jgi:hypothetical protein
MLTTSYRSNDAPPASKIELLNEYCSTEAVPSETFVHPVECDPKENPFNVQYVRSGDVPTGDSRLLYDLGITYLCTSGQQANDTVLGDLYVTYEIELKKPIVASNVTNTILSGSANYVGGVVPGSWFAGTTSIDRVGNYKWERTGNTLTFPRGSVGFFAVDVRISPNTTFTAGDLSSAPVLTNAIPAFITPGISYDRSVVAGATSCNSLYYRFAFLCVDPMAIVTATLPSGSWTGTAASTAVSVTQFLISG